MIAVSGGLMFLGYQLTVYGFSQIRGQNAGFFDILWPGRYKGNTPDALAGNTYTAGKGVNNTAAGGTVGATPNTPNPTTVHPGAGIH
jgi:hypothetical protein